MFASVFVIVFVGEIESAMEFVLLSQITNIYLSSLATIYLQLQKRLQAQLSLHSQLKANNFFRYVSAIVMFESINCIIIKNIGYFVQFNMSSYYSLNGGKAKPKNYFFLQCKRFCAFTRKRVITLLIPIFCIYSSRRI